MKRFSEKKCVREIFEQGVQVEDIKKYFHAYVLIH